MNTKVTFSKPDEVLASIILNLAEKSAGIHLADMMNETYLRKHGCYRFWFTHQQQSIAFDQAITKYIAKETRSLLTISYEAVPALGLK